MKKDAGTGVCPVCDRPYHKTRHRTRHHLFPKFWYRDGLTLYVCSECHQKEFHRIFKMDLEHAWSPSQCLLNWVKYCKSKGKDAFEIYPILTTLESMR